MRLRRLPPAVLAVFLAGTALVAAAAPASAHVLPSTTIQLAVHDADITADLVLPTEDLRTAMDAESTTSATTAGSAVSIPTDGSPLGEQAAGQIEAYLEEHTHLATGDQPRGTWTVDVDDVAATTTQQWGTGDFPAVTASATWTPPAGTSTRTFTLTYDAIVHQVVTADVFVILASDDSDPGAAARNLGEITVDTRTGTLAPLSVDLTRPRDTELTGFAGMLRTGVSHIAEGTDHQLFLLTLLLPAPLLAARGGGTGRRRHGGTGTWRWAGLVPARTAGRRITLTTLAFTVGHSVTLALGALGLPVPQRPVEAAIAVSILVAAVHAVRPLFPGREPLVAGAFGLVHGLAFSATLAALDLSGTQLVWSLLGFNVGIELMQLAVVLLVLPPLVVLARTAAYPALRTGAAVLTGVAAVGWLLDRVGFPTALGTAADGLGAASPWVLAVLWVCAGTALVRPGAHRPPVRRPDGRDAPAPRGEEGSGGRTWRRARAG